MIYLITFWSAIYGVDSKLAVAVAKHESNLNSNATGALKEVGLFQLRPEFVKEYSRKELYDPRINIMVGVKRLAETKKKCKHKGKYEFLVCYNCGVSKGNKIKFPKQFPYVVAVNKKIAQM